jgi:cysteine synthase
MEQIKFLLDEKEMPTAWYNIQADFDKPLPPPINPANGQPIGPDALAPLFPMDIIMQEASVGPYATRFVDIPEEVQQVYRLWRPTPLMRARRLEKLLDTPAQIYYKYEGVSPVGSHKPNTAVAQAYYNKKAGTKRIATETGAGQWGSAVAFSAALFGLEAKVYMVNVSYQQKPYRRMLMETYGAKIVASPSKDTKAGQKFLAQDPNHPGSLGIAISEALEDTITQPDTKYSIGSVFNHVLMHQTIIGEEALKQMERVGAYPDIVIGCIGGGSNFGGVRARQVKGRQKDAYPRGRAYSRAIADKRRLRVRFRRYCADDTPRQDVYPWLGVHPGPDSRRRIALPRYGPHCVQAVRRRCDRSGRGAAERCVRRGGPVHARGRHPTRAGIRTRDPRRDRRSNACKSSRREKSDLVQPQRPRTFRSLGVPTVPRGSTPGL